MSETVRYPVVAGTFYPGRKDALAETVSTLLGPRAQALHRGAPAPVALIAPHAGYPYSGPTAGKGYRAASAWGPPTRVLVIGANHTGLGPSVCTADFPFWRTPLGDVPVDSDAISAIVSRGIPVSRGPFSQEHSIEVQLPFIQSLWGDSAPLVPVCAGYATWQELEAAAEALSAICNADRPALVVASSDFTHYESEDSARSKDRDALDRILALDPLDFYGHCLDRRLSICGAAAITIVMLIAQQLALAASQVVHYATSGEVTGDRSAVVGYASVLFSKE